VFSYVVNLVFEAVYLFLENAPIGFELGFAGAPGADAAPQPFQMAPLPGQAWQKILVLGQLYLQLPLAGPCPFGKDIQNQGCPVNYLDLEGVFQVSLLERRKLVVKDCYAVAGAGFKRYQFFQLTFANIVRFGSPGQALYYFANYIGSGRSRQLSQFVQ